MKKLISMMLTAVMISGMLPVHLFAADGEMCGTGNCTGIYENGYCNVCGTADGSNADSDSSENGDTPSENDGTEETPDIDNINPGEGDITIVCDHSEGICTYESLGDGTHSYVYSCCELSGTEFCSGGTATCVDLAVCDFCEKEYGELDAENHSFSEEWSMDEIEHWHVCVCGAIADKEQHVRGTGELIRTCEICTGETLPATLSASDFCFAAPQDLLYDGSVKAAPVYAIDGVAGIGDISVKYCDANGNYVDPVDAGVYYVSIDVSEGSLYYAASDLAADSWCFEIQKRNVTLTSASDEKEYDGKALGNDSVAVEGDGWACEEGAVFEVAGTQTLVGESENIFSYVLNEGTNADNYNITVVNGVLTVRDRTEKYQITMTANSAEYVYDGTEKIISGFETNTFVFNDVTYTVEGLTADAVQTTAGAYPVEILGEAVVLDPEGNDVTSQFEITKINGEMKIASADPVIGIVSQNGIVYDSTEITEVPLTREDETIEGTLQLINVDVLNVGTGEYEWQFTPADTVNFNVITGVVQLEVTEDVIDHLEVTEIPEKTEYIYGEEFVIDGAVVTAVHISGRTEEVTSMVAFDSLLMAGQTSVEVSYQEKSCLIEGLVVTAKTVENVTIELLQESFPYTGNPIEPEVVVKDEEKVIDVSEYTVAYSDNMDVGIAAITITDVDGGNYVVNGSREFEIVKAESVYKEAPLPNEQLVYTGGEQELITAGLTEDGTILYSLSEEGEYSELLPVAKNAGTYTVWYYVAGDENHIDSAKGSVETTIGKAPLTVAAYDKEIIYGDAPSANGAEYRGLMEAEDFSVLSGELSYKFAYAQYGDVGEYAIVPTGLSADNYEITFVPGTLYVYPRNITITAKSASKTFGEKDPKLSYQVNGLLKGDTLRGGLVRESGENVGSYGIGLGTLSAGSNYRISYTGAAFTICARAITAADFKLGGQLYYSGGQQTQSISSVSGVTYQVSGNSGVNAGNYTMTVTGTGNYTGEVKIGWSIEKTAAVVSKAPAANKLTYNGKGQSLIVPGETAHGSLVYSLNKNGTYNSTVPSGTNAGSYTVYYKVIGDHNHYDSKISSVDVSIGQYDITGKKLDYQLLQDPLYNGKEHVQKIDSVKANGLTVTFQTVSGTKGTDAGKYALVIRGTGNYKGTASFEWNISKKSLVVIAKSQTILFGESISQNEFRTVGLLDGHKINVKLTAGTENVTMGSTITPEKSVILSNGKDVTPNYKIRYVSSTLVIEPELSAMQDLTVNNVTSDNENDVKAVKDMMDSAETENADEKTVQDWERVGSSCSMLLAQLEAVAAKMTWIVDEVARFDVSSVKSSDKEDLETAMGVIDELLEGDNLTETEREAVTESQAETQTFIDVIDNAAAEIHTESIQETETVTAETVVLEDKEVLETAGEELAEALEKNNGNYTEEEKQHIEEEIERIDESLQVVQEADEAFEKISELPETVVPDDEETINKIVEAKEVYDDLTDYEKTIVGEDTVSKLDNLLIDMIAYDILEEDNRDWKKKTEGGLVFTANGLFSKFTGVLMDGEQVSPENYDAQSGSTIVTLKTEYLNTLSYGDHVITIQYTDGETEGSFKLARNFGVLTPLANDKDNLTLWIIIVIAAVSASVIVISRKRNKKSAKA